MKKANQDNLIAFLKKIIESILITTSISLVSIILYNLLNKFLSHSFIVINNKIIYYTIPIVVWIVVTIYLYITEIYNKLYFIKLNIFNKYYNYNILYNYVILNIITFLLVIIIIITQYYEKNYFINILNNILSIIFYICIFIINKNLKQGDLLLYLSNQKKNNSTNYIFYITILGAPIIIIIIACINYLIKFQITLIRIKSSILIGFLSLIIYHIITFWFLIKKKSIILENQQQEQQQQKQNITTYNKKDKKNKTTLQSNNQKKDENKIDEKKIYIDVINSKELFISKFFLIILTLISITILWVDSNYIVNILNKNILYNNHLFIAEEAQIQSLSLNSIIITIIILIITSQMTHNIPALLELMILKYLNLSPGNGYAIVKLTKYTITVIGGMTGLSVIGIEWLKLQWLVAAIGLGLGFGLQEIFANFISGIMILFEKPIRIGDTVTIRRLTGNVVKINTRATTIIDWDRKEIIVPNKAFITEQFINWSLSDSITRITLKILAPMESNIEIITFILEKSAKCCPLVLEIPQPEAFLIDVQNNLLIFELRMYIAEMGHRMAVRHQVHIFIMQYYQEYNVKIPAVVLKLYKDQADSNTTNQDKSSSDQNAIT